MDSLAFGGTMIVNAGGDDEGEISTVFAVRSTGLNDVVLLAGKNAGLEIGETSVQRIVEGTGSYPGYYTPIYGWLGLQVGSIYSAGRIANLDTTKTLTDDMIAELLSRFPSSAPATHLIMSRRSRRQLQDSRTATNPTGSPAPFPDSAFGVKIRVRPNRLAARSQPRAGWRAQARQPTPTLQAAIWQTYLLS